MAGSEFGSADSALRALVAIICAYEVVAITTRKVPTISRIARMNPLVRAVVLAGLERHFQPLE